MGHRLEFDYYIPPDVTVNTDGSISNADWPKVYRFNDEVDKFLLSFTGLGMPGINYITQNGPYQHGETILDYRLASRVIQLEHRRNSNPCEKRQGYWNARADIMNWLRPNRQLANNFGLGRLRKRYPNGELRDIDVIIDSGPVFNPRNPDEWDEWAFTETIRFRSSDPTFYDPELLSAEWTFDEFGGLIFYDTPDWIDHLTFPIVFGSDSISSILQITYPGTWLTYPTFVISGPMSYLLIENQSTDEKIEMDYALPAGESLTISLDYGNKTIIDSSGQNRIGTLTVDSDLSTFHLAPDPEVPNGINIIEVSGSDGIMNQTLVAMKYYVRYIGL